MIECDSQPGHTCFTIMLPIEIISHLSRVMSLSLRLFGNVFGEIHWGRRSDVWGRRRVLVHSSGFKLSPYADIKPAGEDTKSAPRKLWHRSPGSAG